VKVALYARVSTSTQTTENQRLLLEEYAKRQGWDYEYIEEQESTRKTRPKKYELMQRLRNKEFAAICVLKIDRWARSLTELTNEVTELYQKGVKFISIRDNIDLTTATGRLQFNIMASFAEFEREIIRERTLDGLARAKAENKNLGRPLGKKDSQPRKKGGYYLRYMKHGTNRTHPG
jgi:DNA invertase Pin-like site-specific DNA recombinase